MADGLTEPIIQSIVCCKTPMDVFTSNVIVTGAQGLLIRTKPAQWPRVVVQEKLSRVTHRKLVDEIVDSHEKHCSVPVLYTVNERGVSKDGDHSHN
ncbi:hypothetical protein ElyMa_002827100 [Elysia marginata]|uniref:Uncharacterized protein n=1 Tax=Elysia marginata TaxID=1093978 RepID=A0AAV4HSR8_9GAST|nr:hypothetical protein ElyMa_002827100 [Elysia marginata]